MRTFPNLGRICRAGLWTAMLVAGMALADEPAAPAEPGVWQQHEYSFNFMGFTSTYSCDGLATQLRLLLLQSGARADAKAEPGACAAPFGHPDKFARAKLVFFTLVPSGPGAPAGSAGQGRWRPVTLAERRPLDLLIGDCELVEQFRDEVLKKMFTIRNLVDNTRCIPHQESGSLIDLRFETFVAVEDGAAPATAAPERLFVYPKKGQSPAQLDKDRLECQASATAQTGFDPAAPATTKAAANGDSYRRAYAGCLESRGYAVR